MLCKYCLIVVDFVEELKRPNYRMSLVADYGSDSEESNSSGSSTENEQTVMYVKLAIRCIYSLYIFCCIFL